MKDKNNFKKRNSQLTVAELKHLYRTNQLETLRQSVPMLYREFARKADIYKDENASIYNLGFFMGALDIFKEILCCSNEENIIIKFIQINIINKTPYFKEIIFILQEEITIEHNNLVKKLNAEEDKIESIIMEMKKWGLIDVLTPGNFRYYFFSNQGNKIIEIIMPYLNLLVED